MKSKIVKAMCRILKKIIDNKEKFYIEEDDEDLIKAKDLLHSIEQSGVLGDK
ncbi:MAG: hypothetical protein ACI4EY_12475 [Lachnospiraceae bacterium]